MKSTAKDLRLHSKELLEAVARGEEVTITYRGKPRAKLVPAEKHRRRSVAESPIFGLWKGHEETTDVENHVRDIRRSRY